MKKLLMICIVAVMAFALASCGAGVEPEPQDTTASTAPLTLVSCVKETADGLTDTWRLTFSDGTSTTITARNGANGTDGLTPTIGENGNWWIGETDTGVKAEGSDGAPGAPGTAADPLTVVSCKETDYTNGIHTYQITFSDGNTAEFTVKDGENGTPGTPGAAGVSPTVVSCDAVSTLNGVTTWRLTFSDGNTADFTVQNGEGGTSFATEEEWLALIEKMDAISDAFTVYTPNWSVGNSTVTNRAGTSATTVYNDVIVGGAAPLKVSAMFDSSDSVYGVILRSFSLYNSSKLQITKGEVRLEIQIRKANTTTNLANGSTILATYSVTVDAQGTADYRIPVEIKRSDLGDLSDDDIIIFGVYPIAEEVTYACFSSNDTYVQPLAFADGVKAPYANIGYYVKNTTGASTANSYRIYNPDIFFVTEQKMSMIDLGSLGNGGNGGNTTPEEDEEVEEERGMLRLPDQYDLVVGDTFELYYKGISECLNSDLYAYELAFSDGKGHGMNYSRKYLFTPKATDVGKYTMTITVRDNLGAIVDQANVVLNVVPLPASPTEEKVVLVIGDSLTDGGVWASELYRRLTGTGGKPAGAGLSNIRFIGTRESDTGVRYEGYGGWTFDSYTTAYTARKYFMYVYGSFDAATLTQHSVYSDANGQLWKLESIEANRIKIIAVKEVGGDIQQYGSTLPASGTLTYYGGGTSAATITYTSSDYAEGNPFWNLEEDKVDFTAYAAAQGVDKIDEIVVLLGWNNTSLSGGGLAAKAAGFIDLVHAEFPDCHVTLVGLQVPSRDGFAAAYGTTWNYYEKLCKVYEFQDAFIALTKEAKYEGSVSFVSLAGQFDAENNYPTTEIPLNGEKNKDYDTSRDNRTETVQNNGVHPSNKGYYQVADAVYRHLIARWQ